MLFLLLFFFHFKAVLLLVFILIPCSSVINNVSPSPFLFYLPPPPPPRPTPPPPPLHVCASSMLLFIITQLTCDTVVLLQLTCIQTFKLFPVGQTLGYNITSITVQRGAQGPKVTYSDHKQNPNSKSEILFPWIFSSYYHSSSSPSSSWLS